MFNWIAALIKRTMGRCKKGIKPGQSSLSSIILCRMRTGVYRFVTLLMVTGIPMLLTACMMGPDYVKPTVTIPETYKEMDGWKLAQPKDEVIRGPWWEVFDDHQLNELEGQVDIANQNIAIAEAQFRQASALVLAARAAYFPLATAGASANRASGSSSLGREGLATPTNVTTTYLLAGNVSWEADIWGRIRRTVESSRASAQASAADLESVRLSVRAALAENYFLLRTLDRQKQLFDATVEAYRRSLELTTNQYSSGVASRADVLQAETQLKSVQAQAIDVGVLRAQYEHAIAVLVGKPPAQFSLPAAPLQAAPPAAPAGIPSELLERRPDIAAAERRMAAANAQIGVAKAAYFPAVTLGAAGGYE
ncbi:MAG: efflux transporter outer membrane subunit, partial [Deltaproteobacteria bacterium]